MGDKGSNDLSRIAVARRSANELFRLDGSPIGVRLREFWEWSASDLVSNAQRGVLAEYIVALAVGGASGVRTEWDAFDVVAPSGTRIEVKSAAYVQAWAQSAHSPISFDIAPKKSWDASTNTSSPVAVRDADVYVFAVLANRDQATLDPLELRQWNFYVLGTKVLERAVPSQKQISLGSLEKLHPHSCDFTFLPKAIQFALESQEDPGNHPNSRRTS